MRRIEYMRLAAIKGAKRNPKTHASEVLAKSVERFGFADAVILDERTERLVAGHGRIETLVARQKRGEPPPDGVTVDGSDWLVPVQRGWASKSDDDAAAFLVGHNRIGELGGWGDDLDAMLVDLAKSGEAALEGVGYTQDDVDKILRGLQPPEQDDVPDVPETTGIMPGDLFELGEHRLLCGDSTKPADVARLMNGHRAGLMNTDPPYGVSYGNEERPNPGVAKPRVAKPRVANDLLFDEKLQEFLTTAFRAAAAHALDPAAAWYLWHAHLTQGFFAAAAAAAANVVLSRQIIWVKPVFLLTRGQYHWKHEPCFFGWVEGHQPPDYGEGNGERTQTTVWEVEGVKVNERREFNHATPKPTRLFEIPIVKHLRRGEICYEPFAGTGPQFIAAEKTGRRCFGIELEPRYCQVIIERWQKFTGKTAEKL